MVRKKTVKENVNPKPEISGVIKHGDTPVIDLKSQSSYKRNQEHNELLYAN